MDLRNYEVEPDEGQFEMIERRLRLRRQARVGGGVAAACVVAAAVVWMAWPVQRVLPAAEPGMVAAARTPQAPAAEEPAVAAAVVPDDVQGETVVAVAGAGVAEAAEPVVAQPVAAKVAKVGSAAPVVVAESQPAEQPQPVVAAVPQRSAAPEVAEVPVVAEGVPTAQAEGDDKSKGPSSPMAHEDDLIWAPNVIVPNGDVDENRTFKLKFSSAVTDFRVVIFNRGGRQVYQSNDPAFEWDGRHDGTAMPQGAYVWVAKFRDSTGRSRQEKGTVTIIR